MFQVGDQVERHQSFTAYDWKDLGNGRFHKHNPRTMRYYDVGTVVEVNDAGRCRILWTTYGIGLPTPSTTKPKRTWVQANALRKAAAEAR
jgi:hypothetical protein